MDIIKAELHIICNSCGELMRDMGEWPVQYPRNESKAMMTMQCRRFMCKTCRVPSPNYEKGYPVGIAIIDSGDPDQ